MGYIYEKTRQLSKKSHSEQWSQMANDLLLAIGEQLKVHSQLLEFLLVGLCVEGYIWCKKLKSYSWGLNKRRDINEEMNYYVLGGLMNRKSDSWVKNNFLDAHQAHYRCDSIELATRAIIK